MAVKMAVPPPRRRRLRERSYPRSLVSELYVRVSSLIQLKHGIMPLGTLSVPLYGTRFRYRSLFGMNLVMAVRVYKNAVLRAVASSCCLVDNMMVVPTCFFRYRLVAVRADAFLFFPK